MDTQKQKKRFIVFSGTGKQQNGNTVLDDADLDTRDNCTFTIEDVVTTETVYDCAQQDIHEETVESQMKMLTVTYTTVTAQIIARWLAYFLSAAAAPITSGGKKKHALTRSTNDELSAFSFVEGFEDDETPAQKYKNFKVDSLAFTLNRRKNVGLTVKAVGHFVTADVGEDFVLPECQNLPALKGKDCGFLMNAVDYSSLLWQAGLSVNNSIPTGDDAFPFNGINVETLERGEKPTYPGNVQILGSKGDAPYALGESRAKEDVQFNFGAGADDRVEVVMPSTMIKLAGTPTVFVGELNRSAIALELNPHKDAGLKAPIKVDAYLAQTAAFLDVTEE